MFEVVVSRRGEEDMEDFPDSRTADKTWQSCPVLEVLYERRVIPKILRG